ncbi:MAG: ATP-binding protein, partial [Burkholderiaceae bacterium]
QEALNNIRKHAQATEVSVSLIVQPDTLSMEITDNGVGIQGQFKSGNGHFGLRGLTERARLAGGWLDVCPNPNKGTSLLLSLPVGSNRDGVDDSASTGPSDNDRNEALVNSEIVTVPPQAIEVVAQGNPEAVE